MNVKQMACTYSWVCCYSLWLKATNKCTAEQVRHEDVYLKIEGPLHSTVCMYINFSFGALSVTKASV